MSMIICGFTAVRQEISEGNVRLLLRADEFRCEANTEFLRPLMRRSPSTPARAKTVTAHPAPSSIRGPRPIRLPARAVPAEETAILRAPMDTYTWARASGGAYTARTASVAVNSRALAA